MQKFHFVFDNAINVNCCVYSLLHGLIAKTWMVSAEIIGTYDCQGNNYITQNLLLDEIRNVCYEVLNNRILTPAYPDKPLLYSVDKKPTLFEFRSTTDSLKFKDSMNRFVLSQHPNTALSSEEDIASMVQSTLNKRLYEKYKPVCKNIIFESHINLNMIATPQDYIKINLLRSFPNYHAAQLEGCEALLNVKINDSSITTAAYRLKTLYDQKILVSYETVDPKKSQKAEAVVVLDTNGDVILEQKDDIVVLPEIPSIENLTKYMGRVVAEEIADQGDKIEVSLNLGGSGTYIYHIDNVNTERSDFHKQMGVVEKHLGIKKRK